MGRGGVILALVVASAAAAPTAARAQPSAAAEKAFREGRDLLASGRHSEACAKFEESQRLEPAVGTLLNLADCYERLGRTASAWEVFRKIEALAAADQAARAAEAGRRAKLLEPTLCKLRLTASERPPGLQVKLDGNVVTLLGDIPIDPGSHQIEASAPDREPWSDRVTVKQPGATVEVVLPELAVAQENVSVTAGEPVGVERPRGRRMTPLVWSFAIAGGLALGAGAIVDATAYSDLRGCRDAGGCASEDELQSIENRFVVGDIVLGAAVASLSAAALFYLWSDDGSRRIDVTIAPAEGSTALVVVGQF